MNFLHKYLTSISKKDEKGFTLIELLVVTMFLGVLCLIGFPNYLNQVGKSRETESQMIMGNLNRAQQAYHFEQGKFADEIDLLGLGFEQRYHTFQLAGIVTDDFEIEARHIIAAIDSDQSRVRDLALGIFFDQGKFSSVACQGYDIGVTVSVTVARDCANNGIRLY